MMKFIMKKKFFIVVVTMFLCFIILDKIFIIKIKYRTNLEPVYYYSVEISRISKKLKIVENKYCSEEDCNDELVRKSINLTNQEYAYIKNILSQNYDKATFMNAISALTKDDKEMFSRGQDGYEDKDDLNKDGVITYREFANSYLEILSK